MRFRIGGGGGCLQPCFGAGDLWHRYHDTPAWIGGGISTAVFGIGAPQQIARGITLVKRRRCQFQLG